MNEPVARMIFDYSVGKPRRLTNIGRFIGSAGWFVFLAGFFGHDGVKKISEAFPYLPLWWVPESVLAHVLAVISVIAGVCIVQIGLRVDRLHQSS